MSQSSSSFAARASTTSPSTSCGCPSGSWWSSPACRARASRRWRSTRSTPRGSAATSSRCRRTRASSSGQMEKPKYEQLRGLSPTIAIEQKTASSNPRSTVGTITEIYDYLRVLYARVGEQHCHLCGGAVTARSRRRDRRRAADAAAAHQGGAAGAQGREPQGRVPRGLRGGAQGRLRARAHRRAHPAPRGRHRARQEEEAHDRARDRPRQHRSRATARASPTRSRLPSRRAAARSWSRSTGEARERAFSEARACPSCGVGLPELSPQTFSFNSPLGMCVDCNGLGTRLEVDPDLIVPNADLIDPRRRDRAVGRSHRARRRLDRQRRRRRVARVRHPARHAVEEPDAAPARGAAVRHRRAAHGGHLVGQARRRLVGHALRGRRQHAQEAHAGDQLGGDAPVVRALLPRVAVPRLRRAPPAPRDARRAARRQEHRRGQRHDRRRGEPLLRQPRAQGRARADRHRDPQGDERAARLPARRRARVPDARPRGGDALGRRGAAHPAGVAARLRAVGRDVRARRAVDRPAPARQPAPDRDAAAAARSRQQRDRRRARRGDDRGGRLRRRLRPGRGAPRRARRRPGDARRRSRPTRRRRPGAICRASSASRSRSDAPQAEGLHHHQGRARAQPQEHRRAVPARRVRRRDRRVGRRQDVADQRHPAPGAASARCSAATIASGCTAG